MTAPDIARIRALAEKAGPLGFVPVSVDNVLALCEMAEQALKVYVGPSVTVQTEHRS